MKSVTSSCELVLESSSGMRKDQRSEKMGVIVELGEIAEEIIF